ncbi:hypothetical protein BC833DRAFT_594225 [Globomyces pollinis-pini]|nr:hypothetical protein BC833DRAFT_594225 [Globomyces pollinis-pini]KAJ2987457.1 hypothetical protein HDV02_006118 [Globomyces sp. JEL0801]
MIPLTFSAVQSAVPFVNLVIGTTAMSINIAQAKKLKGEIRQLETQNKEASERYKQLESDKRRLSTISLNEKRRLSTISLPGLSRQDVTEEDTSMLFLF